MAFLAPFVALAFFAAISRAGNAWNSRIEHQVAFAVCSAAVLVAIPITAKLLMDSMFSCYANVQGCPAPSDTVRALYQSAAYCTGASGACLLAALVLLSMIRSRAESRMQHKDAPAASLMDGRL